jgi:serine protease Do
MFQASHSKRQLREVTPMRPGRGWVLFAVAAAVLLAGWLGLEYLAVLTAGRVSAQANLDSQQAIVRAVQLVRPSVVNIDTISYTREQVPEVFREFFGPGVEQPFPREGVGSGVIVDPEGYILTNYHVVRGATQVTATLSDGRDLPARIVGTDRTTDMAVVKVNARGLPAVRLGSAAQLPIGSWVIALGNPFRLQSTVTVGVLSARGRTLEAPDGRVLSGLLQTDAAINPGNSGGALVDVSGRLIGIPTAIIGSAQGLGFAVSVDEAAPVMRQLIARGRVERPWLGVYYAQITPELQQQFNLRQREGVVIVRVVAGSPAEAAGLAPGDVISAANGRPVQNPEQLRTLVSSLAPGATMRLEASRGDRTRQVQVKLGVAPAEQPEGGR